VFPPPHPSPMASPTCKCHIFHSIPSRESDKRGETIAPVNKNTTYYYSYMPHIIDQILAKIFGAYHGLVNNVKTEGFKENN